MRAYIQIHIRDVESKRSKIAACTIECKQDLETLFAKLEKEACLTGVLNDLGMTPKNLIKRGQHQYKPKATVEPAAPKRTALAAPAPKPAKKVVPVPAKPKARLAPTPIKPVRKPRD